MSTEDPVSYWQMRHLAGGRSKLWRLRIDDLFYEALTTEAPGSHELIYTEGAGAVSGARLERRMIEGLLQPSHLLIILVVALFIFGPKKLPELGQGLGKGIRSFRDSMKAASEEPEKVETPASKPAEPPK